MTTRIDLINEALLLNGSQPIDDEYAAGASQHIAAFNRATDLILTCHPWTFCTFTRELNRMAAGGETHWAYVFNLPDDRIGAPRAVFNRSDRRIPFTEFELFGKNELRTNAEQIWVQFTKNVEPAYWPGYVREVITLLLRSELALAIREDRVLRDRLREDAIGTPSQMLQGGLLVVARGINDMSKPSPVIGEADNPLISVRSVGGG